METKPSCTQQQMEHHIRFYLDYVKQQAGGEKIIGMLAPEFVACDLAARSLTLRFAVQPWMLNVGGTMHGGLITTAFDTSFGSLTNFFSRAHYITTTNLAVSFLAPVVADSELRITVSASRVGRTLCSLTGEAFCVSGDECRLCDTATATFMFLQEEFHLPEA